MEAVAGHADIGAAGGEVIEAFGDFTLAACEIAAEVSELLLLRVHPSSTISS